MTIVTKVFYLYIIAQNTLVTETPCDYFDSSYIILTAELLINRRPNHIKIVRGKTDQFILFCF